ncbi:hypothetical protein C8J56DRAFT_890843 [Mycena floridula]|nr:hypothetical protein C8J56DRAFT_890843 [Mycena floridula]
MYLWVLEIAPPPRHALQVIVKLANIILTPDKPEYPGGIRHVERMTNECIVSTFIYYYEADNIKPYDLGFRMAVQQLDYMLQHLQDDDTCQEVSPFKLADPTKPGSRKILVFFLVNPMCHIHSSTNILPQQFEIVKEIFHLQGIPEYLLDESTRNFSCVNIDLELYVHGTRPESVVLTCTITGRNSSWLQFAPIFVNLRNVLMAP